MSALRRTPATAASCSHGGYVTAFPGYFLPAASSAIFAIGWYYCGVSGFLQTKQWLVLMTSEEVGKCCLGLVGSAMGPKTRVCIAPKMSGGETCGASSHATKGFVVTDAYYVPAKMKSILQWPFVTRKHVKMAKSAQLATAFALTEDHLEAIHLLYDTHPQFLTELVLQPPIRTLLNAPDPVGIRAMGSCSSSVGSWGSVFLMHQLLHLARIST